MTWTSTTFATWQNDCEQHLQVGGSFAVKGVATNDHKAFLELICARYNYKFSMAKDIAILQTEFCDCDCHVDFTVHFMPCCVGVPCKTNTGVNYVWYAEHLVRCPICRDSRSY